MCGPANIAGCTRPAGCLFSVVYLCYLICNLPGGNPTDFFSGLIILIGFLTYPAKKGDIRENYMPIGDIIFMIAGTGAFLYFTFSANQIINQGTRFAPYQIVIGIIGIAALIELTRRCVGLPILFVAGFFLIYALAVGLTNPAFLEE